MNRTATDGSGTADGATATAARSATERDRDAEASQYEHLRAKRKEKQGNVERARVRDVHVGESEVALRATFEWSSETLRFAYDLDDDRDVLKLEALTEASGFDFEQVSFLEGEDLPVVYTGSEWVPEAHVAYVEGEGSAGETFRTELRLLVRELARSPKLVRRLVRASRTLSTKQIIVAVVLVKKLIVVALLAWLLL